jgi:basic amino acid/polyamine antiporter, APA family
MKPLVNDLEPVQARLGLWDAVSIIIGIVIGAGIYETPPLIFKNVYGPWEGVGVWALGGVLSLVGALCYAELASTYRRSGGDYVYLTRAFGPWAGFLFGWAQLVIIRTGNIGMLAYIFADYALRLWDFGAGDPRPLTEGQVTLLYAVAAVTVLTLLNILGVVFGKSTQNVLTAAKVLGLGGILLAGLLAPYSGGSAPVKAGNLDPSFGFAMILVLYAYGGWNDAALVASEQRNPRRNIPLALILGTLAIMLIYVLVNAAYLRSLGFERARDSTAIAADTLKGFQGIRASKFMSVLVMISALGAINGMVFTGSRVYSALGADYSIFAWLGRWDRRLGSPVWSLAVQLAIILGMIWAVGSEAGRAGINWLFSTWLLSALGFEPLRWEGHGGFETLLRCTAPAFWLFFLLTGLCVFILRERDRDIDRPFTTPLYPLLPLIFCDTCAYMLFSSTNYAGKLSLIAFAVLHLGLLFYWLSKRRVPADEETDSASLSPTR